METFDLFIKIVGIVGIVGAAIVGLTLIVLKIVTHVSGKWLDAKFDERLQALKHQHGKEIERLRFKISTLLDRATKLHQREFEVLPEVWFKLNDAFWKAKAILASIKESPDIDRMPEPQQSEFIASCSLSQSEKAEVREAEDKNKSYSEKMFWHEIGDAIAKSEEAYTYLIKNGIFLPDDIRAKFAVINDLVWKTLVEREKNVREGFKFFRTKHIDQFSSEGDNLMKELERLVHERIWPADDTNLAKKL
jgi:hypothetical protein